MKTTTNLAPLLERFFTQRLMQQRQVSPHTISSYRHAKVATKVCPSLKSKRVTVHVLRHTMAIDLLQGGVDRSVIALWLGHESVETTQIYLEATLAMKEKALGKTKSLEGKFKRYRPGDQLLGFLNNL